MKRSGTAAGKGQSKSVARLQSAKSRPWELIRAHLGGADRFRPPRVRDIANLLDTRIETVSRVLQQLNREQAIHVRGNRVRLLTLASSTPGGVFARMT